MLYRKLDANGDMVFGGNANDFYSGSIAVAQAIYTSLRLLQGEWWEDQSRGLPLFQHMIGTSGTPDQIRGVDALVQEAILNVQGVQAIMAFSSTYSERAYTITTCNVQTIYGHLDFLSAAGWKQSNGQYVLTLFPVVYQMS